MHSSSIEAATVAQGQQPRFRAGVRVAGRFALMQLKVQRADVTPQIRNGYNIRYYNNRDDNCRSAASAPCRFY